MGDGVVGGVVQLHPRSQRLIDLVYAALLGESSWQAFLEELSAALPIGKATMFYHDAHTSAGALQLSAGIDTSLTAEYEKHYARINPWMRGATTRPLGRVVVADAMLPRSELARTEFYNDFLRPRDVHTGIGVTLRREEACNFLLSVMSADVDEADAREVVDSVQAVVPHLQRAFDYYRRGQAGLFGLLSDTGFGPLRVGVLHLGPHLKVRRANTIARQLSETSQSFRIDCSGRFRCCDANVIGFIEAALAAWPSGGGAPLRAFLVRRQDSELPLRMTVLAPRQECDQAFFRGPECILLVEDPQLDLAPAVEEFGAFYRMTSAEKRVVLGLASGLTVEQVAAEAGTTTGNNQGYYGRGRSGTWRYQ
jgi:hypothetical protein